jgi:hypothetical protein
MSFPYRLIEVFTHDAVIQVICLRLINAGLMIAALLILRRLFRLLGVSTALANVLVLAFAFTPLVTVLAAQINYDNLLILAVSASLCLAVSFLQALRKKQLHAGRLLVLLSLCLLASLIKFAFLPVFAAIVIVVAWEIIRYGRPAQARKSFTALNRGVKLLLAVIVLASGLLFVRFYGVNLVRYHSPSPQCDQVLSVPACSHYYAWNNSYTLQTYKQNHHITDRGPLSYTAWWLTVSSLELFGALVPLQGDIYASITLLIIVSLLGTAAFILTAINLRKILRGRSDMWLLLSVVLMYVAVLWLRNYHDYLKVGQATFIHGRYLVPILPALYVLLALGVREAFTNHRQILLIKSGLATLVVVAFMYFGGFHQYITRVDPVYGHLSSNNQFNLRNASRIVK